MTTIEDRLRELGDAVPTPALPAAAAVMRRGRQRRRRRRGIGLAAAALVGSTAGVAVRSLGPERGDEAVRTAPGRTDTSATDRPGTVPGRPALRAVPDVVGLTVARARPIIEDSGLIVAAPSGDWAEIVAQDPAPGTLLYVGRAVTLDVGDLDRPERVDGPVIRGTLLDGRRWTVGSSTSHGLCVTLGPSDLGCDDIGPAIPPGADPATPRVGADVATGAAHPADEAGALVFAFLPPGAETVELVHDDGRTVTAGLTVEPTGRFWAMPVQPGDNPETAVYRGADGNEVARFPTAG